jgi:hypothetical protein
MFYAERAPAPTRASSPRQLPTDHDHAVPTREYQSDQSSRMLLGCHRPCCPKPTLKAHQRERVPAPPPVEVWVDARTVLAVKGSLRRAKPGSPLTAPRRSGRMVIATGGSGGNTSAMPAQNKKGRPPSCGGKPA